MYLPYINHNQVPIQNAISVEKVFMTQLINNVIFSGFETKCLKHSTHQIMKIVSVVMYIFSF